MTNFEKYFLNRYERFMPDDIANILVYGEGKCAFCKNECNPNGKEYCEMPDGTNCYEGIIEWFESEVDNDT